MSKSPTSSESTSPQYEFSEAENQILIRLIKKMKLAGLSIILGGILFALYNVKSWYLYAGSEQEKKQEVSSIDSQVKKEELSTATKPEEPKLDPSTTSPIAAPADSSSKTTQSSGKENLAYCMICHLDYFL